MNRLQAVRQPSRYIEEPHLVILLDGQPLDQLLARLTGNDDLEGLVTTLTDCLSSPDERPVAWNRILPEDGSTEAVPLLVCPDDLDFYCTVMVVEVSRDSQCVFWRRFGLDVTDAPTPEKIGKHVEWFAGIEPFQFDLKEYREFLQTCHNLKTEWWTRG